MNESPDPQPTGWRAKFSRRRFLLASLAGAALTGAASAGAAIDARYIEPNWLALERVKINLPNRKLNAPIRLLQLSDFHYSRSVPLRLIEHAITLGLAQKPDLICLTGDFITHGFPEIPLYTAAFRKLSAAAPTYAVFGNHDGGAWAGPYGGFPSVERVRNLLTDAGVTVLHNRSIDTTIANNPIRLVGLGDLWAKECDPAAAFPPNTPATNLPTILLSHNPDSKSHLKDYLWDLMLSGHTHGGQIMLPFFGSPFAPVADKRYVAGLYPWENRQIYITRGVGNLHGVRFNCRPEVTLLEITSA